MIVQKFEFNLFGVNTYIIHDPDTKQAAVIDPGMTDSNECHAIDSYIAGNELHVKYLINTHMHIDHLFGDQYIAAKFNVGITASEADKILSSRIAEQARMFHLRTDMPDEIEITNPVTDGDSLALGNEAIQILAVPGHSPGSIALYAPQSNFVITGDALFRYSIGRTDLPGGNHRQLIQSITTKLLTLPPSTIVYPGHGPSTTIAAEKLHNPFIR